MEAYYIITIMVRTRIAPSPTGYPHIGTIYQVLFDYAYAKKYKGEFIMRIEDTDRNRFIEGAEKVIYDSIDWFGLYEDESPRKPGKHAPYRQSERLSIYKEFAETLITNGHACYCFCTKERLDEMRKQQEANKMTPRYDKTCRNLSQDIVASNLQKGIQHVIRMKVPENQTVSFTDLIIGDISFSTNDIDDQIIMKADGFPTYHLAVVIDDHLMEITHIIRGREWIPSTPKHILLYNFFGWEIPTHAHLPLILNSDGKGKLSKRHGHASVDYYKDLGYLPDAVLNFLSNLVWYHPEGKEIYDIEEFINLFKLEKINSQGARFNLDKLDWMNGEYIRKMDDLELKSIVFNFYKEQYDEELIGKTIPLIKERIKKLSDYYPLCEFLFKKPDSYEVDLIQHKQMFEKVLSVLVSLDNWRANLIGEALQDLATKESIKFSEFFMNLRVSITGKKISPPLNESLELLGKEETISRIEAIAKQSF